jgi:hypothetical protein
MIIATNETPDEVEKRYLFYLAFNSVFGYFERGEVFERIENCRDYKEYQLIEHKLLSAQKTIDQIQNPSQTDIKNHINKLI